MPSDKSKYSECFCSIFNSFDSDKYEFVDWLISLRKIWIVGG